MNEFASEEEIVAAGLAVVAEDTGRVLMLQRALTEEDEAAGKWEFPGGTIDPGETPLETAKREWSEETGSNIPKGKLDGEWVSPNGIYKLFVFKIKKESDLTINIDHEDRNVINPDDPDGDQIETIAWWDIEDLVSNPALREEARSTNWNLLRKEPKIENHTPSTLSFSTEEMLSLVNLSLIEKPGFHYHYDPITLEAVPVPNISEFYNTCHNPEDGRFCSGPGAGVVGKSVLYDPDGRPAKIDPKDVKRGKKGASLADPHEGTVEHDGIRGYDKNGKPVPGTDAYLEAHNISRDIFESRPYVKYEASREDSALLEAYPKDKYPKGHKLFTSTAEDTDPPQSGGYIMYKTPVPETPHGEIAPQIRPNAPIVTDKGERAKARTVLENSKKRLEVLEKTTPQQLIKERRAEVKRATEDLERAKKATPETVKAEAAKNYEAAKETYKNIKASTNDPDIIAAAKKDISREKRDYEKTVRRANNPNFKEALIETKTLHLKSAENHLANAIEDPKGALADAIRRQKGLIKRETNTYEKTAAKYLFTPGVTSARIDMGNDPQNVKNLTKGKGRIYLAMEGSIKSDAILTAIRKEDPTAAVVNVPSVTLWQQKNLAPEIPNEMGWFAQKYAKGRDVILIPDADGVKNNAVMSQAKALKSALLQNGAGQVYLATPPLKPGTTRVVEEFKLPSGKVEERKGIDDHLGAGRGTLGQLRYRTFTEYPDYDLTSYTKAGGATGKEKMSAGAQKNAEKVLAAISGLVEDRGIATIPAKTLNQTAGFRESQKTSALDARNTLERLGIIKVEYVYDKKALARGERVLNPNMSAKRRDELVKMGVIKEPHIYKKYVEVSFDESPVITILKPEYIIKKENVHTGSLAELPNWNPPKSFKGWTSAVDGRPDSTGIAAKQETNHQKFIAANKKRQATQVKPGRTTEERLKEKKAPPGRRLVRTEEGAKRYGVPIGSPIPLSNDDLTSMVLLSALYSESELQEFYNQCHDENGRFCEGEDGPGRARDKAKTGKSQIYTGDWPPRGGRPVETLLSDSGIPTTVDDVEDVRAVYEVTDLYGNKTRLYDKTGEAESHVNDLLQNHARLNEMYHFDKPRDIIIDNFTDNDSIRILGGEEGDFAFVRSDEPYTRVNSDYLNYDFTTQPEGKVMPSAYGRSSNDYRDYLLTHEYGHHLDFSKRWDPSTGELRDHPLTSNSDFRKYLSDYGRSGNNGTEAYAEAFAEWHNTNGRTQNPAAIAMARYEGWNGNGVTPTHRTFSSDKDSVMNLVSCNLVSFQEENMVKKIVVTDNFISGKSKISGIDKTKPATDEEISKANQIMEEVLKELGLKGDK